MFSTSLIILVLAQLGAGLLNLLLHAPIWLQLVHLLLSDLIWLALALLGFNALAQRERDSENRGADFSPLWQASGLKPAPQLAKESNGN